MSKAKKKPVKALRHKQGKPAQAGKLEASQTRCYEHHEALSGTLRDLLQIKASLGRTRYFGVSAESFSGRSGRPVVQDKELRERD